MAATFLLTRCGGAAVCLLLLFCFAAPAHGGELRTLGGETYEGDLRLDTGGVNIQQKGQPARHFDLANIFWADFLDPSSPQSSDALKPGVQLRNGTLVGGVPTDITPTVVRVNVSKQTKEFQLANVARVIFAPVPVAVERTIQSGFVGALLPGGDLYEGEVRGMDQKPVAVRVNSSVMGLHRFDVSQHELLAVALHDLGPSSEAIFRVREMDGSQYSPLALQANADGLTLRDSILGEVKIVPKQIAFISAGDGRVQRLGELRAVAVRSTNPVKAPAKITADAMPGGAAIKLAQQTYESGIVQAAGVAVSYNVPAGFSIFVATIGLPEGGVTGETVFYSLVADGRVVWRSPQPVTAGGAPVPMRWNLGTGVRTITLFVEPAQPAGLGIQAVWADAMLVKP